MRPGEKTTDKKERKEEGKKKRRGEGGRQKSLTLHTRSFGVTGALKLCFSCTGDLLIRGHGGTVRLDRSLSSLHSYHMDPPVEKSREGFLEVHLPFWREGLLGLLGRFLLEGPISLK